MLNNLRFPSTQVSSPGLSALDQGVVRMLYCSLGFLLSVFFLQYGRGILRMKFLIYRFIFLNKWISFESWETGLFICFSSQQFILVDNWYSAWSNFDSKAHRFSNPRLWYFSPAPYVWSSVGVSGLMWSSAVNEAFRLGFTLDIEVSGSEYFGFCWEHLHR